MTKQEYRRKYIHHLPLACQRFINSRNKWGRDTQLCIDHFIKLLKNPNYYYDYKDVNTKIKVVQLMHWWKGEKAGELIHLEDFQIFFICGVFGFKYKDKPKKRVVKEAVLSLARKNGKTALIALIAILHILTDKESAPEVYSAATKQAQAALVFKDIMNFAKTSVDIKKLFKFKFNLISCPINNGLIQPLGSDSNKQDGLNCSLAIMDELHSWSSRDLFDVLASSQGARINPLILSISTAGVNLWSFYRSYEEYCLKTVDGTFENDEIFPLIFHLDKNDDPFNPKTFYKANPGLNTIKEESSLLKELNIAKQFKSKQKDFFTKQLNMWVDEASEWISVREFSQLTKIYSPEELKGKDCYIGVDLSKSSDLTVLSLIFPVQSGIDKVHIQPIFYIPNKTAQIKELEDRVPYSEWEEEGYVNLTEEPIISQKQILDTILEIASSYRVLKVYYDAYQFSILKEVLEENNIHCESVPQNAIHLTPLIRIFEDMIKLNNITHSGNPCLIWNLSNCRLKESDSRLLKIVKDKPNQKIDGIIASLVGMKGLEQTKQEPQGDILDFLK